MAALPPETRIGAVHLTVRDVASLSHFYAGDLGLERNSGDALPVRLGAGGHDLIVLHPSPAAPRARNTTGLYHLALLLPSRDDLGRCLGRLLAGGVRMTGAADHLVSEALYLSDPEGNGIEIYRDRPRGEWRRESDGSVRMATDPIDLDGLVATGGGAPWTGMPAETRVGHVHLRVSDLSESEAFYVGVLGFEVTARWGYSALFVAAGGYHHHVGLNTWGGAGAPAPPAGAAGLREFAVELPDRAACERAAERARRAGVAVTARPDGFALADPSFHRIVLVADSRVGSVAA